MEFLEIANSRYTTKKYDRETKLTDETIEKLKEILRLSPSSINSQPWKFVFVSDEQVKSQLAEASYFNKNKINEASHLIVFNVIDDIEQFEAHIQAHLPEGSVAYYNTFIKSLPESEIKSWLAHQVYLSLGYFLSACAVMGVDSSPMEGIENEKYTRILSLSGYKTLFAVAIGRRDTTDANQPVLKPKSRLALDKVVVSI